MQLTQVGAAPTPWGDDLGTVLDLGVRTWGNDPRASAVALVGCCQTSGEISRWLMETPRSPAPAASFCSSWRRR